MMNWLVKLFKGVEKHKPCEGECACRDQKLELAFDKHSSKQQEVRARLHRIGTAKVTGRRLPNEVA